jgi:hypothetical protein
LLTAFAVALTVTTLGCTEDDTASPSSSIAEQARRSPTTTTTTTTEATTGSTSSTTTSSTVEDEIISRYVGYWDARFSANSHTPNPNDPALREYATGAQLEAVVTETQRNLDEGLAFRRATRPANVQRVNVVEVEDEQAVVQECVVTDGVIFRRDTGEVVNGDVYTQNVRGELRRVDGVWKVSAARLIQQWKGVAGCAKAS